MKLTWHWKIPIFNRKYIFKWWGFPWHVFGGVCVIFETHPVRYIQKNHLRFVFRKSMIVTNTVYHPETVQETAKVSTRNLTPTERWPIDPWLFAVFMGLYCPVILSFLISHSQKQSGCIMEMSCRRGWTLRLRNCAKKNLGSSKVAPLVVPGCLGYVQSGPLP